MTERELLYRSATDWADLEIRTDGEEGIVSGIAVPWEKPTRINPTLTEVFSRGAFDAQMSKPGGVFLARNHIPLGGTPIGRLTDMRNDSRGLYVEGKVSRTQVGEETLTLLRDGVLDSFSIGFLEGRNRREDGGITRRQTATLREVAIVLQPAYADALVTGLRNGCPTCAAQADEHHHEGEEIENRNLAEAARILATVGSLPAVPRSRPR